MVDGGYLIRREVLIVDRLERKGEGWQVGGPQVEVLTQPSPCQLFVADLIVPSMVYDYTKQLQEIDLLAANLWFAHKLSSSLFMVGGERLDKSYVFWGVVYGCR